MCRIWGEHGQDALENAKVCLLNCGPTGSEALKNLVLGGIGSFTIVDGKKVEPSDLGNNFLREFHVPFHPSWVKRNMENQHMVMHVV